MIITLILDFIASIISQILSILPSVGVSDIPLIGSFISYYFSLAVGYWNTFLTLFPPFAVVWSAFLYIIIPFEISMIILKVFFGSRLPAHTN